MIVCFVFFCFVLLFFLKKIYRTISDITNETETTEPGVLDDSMLKNESRFPSKQDARDELNETTNSPAKQENMMDDRDVTNKTLWKQCKRNADRYFECLEILENLPLKGDVIDIKYPNNPKIQNARIVYSNFRG